MNPSNKEKFVRTGMAMCAVFLVSLAALAGSSRTLILSNTDVSATFNVMGFYDTGVSYGTFTWVGDTSSFGSRTAVTDTFIQSTGAVDLAGANDSVSIADHLDTYQVGPSGLFHAASSKERIENILADSNFSEFVLGSIVDTGTSSAMFGIRYVLGGSGDIFVALRSNSLESAALFGGSATQDTFVGVHFFRSASIGTDAIPGLITLNKEGETAAAINLLYKAVAGVDTMIGVTIDSSGLGGQLLLRADSGVTISVDTSARFSDTLSIFRLAFTADSSLVTLIQDTSSAQETGAMHLQQMGIMVRPDTDLDTSQIVGFWEAAMVTPGLNLVNNSGAQPALRTVMGLFDFKGGGVGSYSNELAAPDYFADTEISYVIGTDTLSGIFPLGIEHLLVTFSPDSTRTITARMYLSNTGKVMTITGNLPSDTIGGVPAKRTNTIEEAVVFAEPETPVLQDGLWIMVKVDTGATAAPPTLHFSLFDTQSFFVRDYKDLRDDNLVNLGIDTIFAVFGITFDTPILAVDSISVLINIDGYQGDTNRATDLTLLFFDTQSSKWVQLASSQIDSKGTGFLLFTPSHFSIFALADNATAPVWADGPSSCLIEKAFVGSGFESFKMLPLLREFRDQMLNFAPCRMLVKMYYFLFGGLT